jgi:hypothetical protein
MPITNKRPPKNDHFGFDSDFKITQLHIYRTIEHDAKPAT